MLMRIDPFRELDGLSQRVFGTAARPAAMPMDAYRVDESFIVEFDLPGVDADSIDLTVEQNVLTVRAERNGTQDETREMIAAERPRGTFTRQLFLGETLDTERLEAGYDAGVLTLRIPIAERAKPRRVSVTASSGKKAVAS